MDFNKNAILKNVKQILSNRKTALMTEQTYKFISLRCGTIAHFSKEGWCEAYSDVRDFIRLFLVKNEYGQNLKERDTMPRFLEADMKETVDIINGIIELCELYREAVFDSAEAEEQRIKEEIIRKLQDSEITIRELGIKLK